MRLFLRQSNHNRQACPTVFGWAPTAVSRVARPLAVLFLLLLPGRMLAQYNTDRLMESGQVAMHYQDYVLSIQYFNRIIALKPYLYQPWFFRGVDKYYLDDFVGSEDDVTHAISLNPYVNEMYELRALARIRQNKLSDAIADYNQAIALMSMTRNYWYNRAICMMNLKDYDAALLQTDTIAQKWRDFAPNYSLKAEIYLQKKDTTEAAKWLDKSLEIDPYDGDTWTTRAYISLSRRQWKDADTELSKAIHLKPKTVGNYVNRALCRYNINNLRGAMEDYDQALSLDPNNFLAHYNRGLLRMQLGDDNRAITDFDYVIKMEPQNFMAIFNRALLLDRTGDLKGAIRDYSAVIAQFPNFWTGLSYRARCYRRLGMTAKAELDEFRIFKAQMDKHIGIQQRWSKSKIKQLRKRSEIDPDKYNQVVVDDEVHYQHEFKSEYRGQVQNRNVEVTFLPMFSMSFQSYHNGVSSYQVYDRSLEKFNSTTRSARHLYLNCASGQLSETLSKASFDLVDSLSRAISSVSSMKAVAPLVLMRAAAYTTVQDFEAAINDLTVYIQYDPNMAWAYSQRGLCQVKLNDYAASKGTDTRSTQTQAHDDLVKAVSLDPDNAYLHYNLGNFYAANADYGKAIDEYTIAISKNANFAEAYYNRGLARMKSDNHKGGTADLSKAGELGLYDAYSIIKQFSASKK